MQDAEFGLSLHCHVDCTSASLPQPTDVAHYSAVELMWRITICTTDVANHCHVFERKCLFQDRNWSRHCTHSSDIWYYCFRNIKVFKQQLQRWHLWISSLTSKESRQSILHKEEMTYPSKLPCCSFEFASELVICLVQGLLPAALPEPAGLLSVARHIPRWAKGHQLTLA